MRKTAGNAAFDALSATNVSPMTAMDAEAPTESEIDSAEELKPWFCGVEYASVRTVRRGYMSPAHRRAALVRPSPAVVAENP